MHVFGLFPHADHVCARYRLQAYKPWLERHGMRVELEPIPAGAWERLKLFRRIRGADTVILQRHMFSASSLYLLRRAARRLIFDFDDAIFQNDSYATRPNRELMRLARFASIVRAADLVVAGNSFLRSEAARFIPDHLLHTIPTCVDPARYPLAHHTRQGAGVQLAWIGSSSTLQGIERQRPLFDMLPRHVPGLELKVICDRFPEFRRMPVVPVRWASATEAQELAGADIGVSWVPNDRWSQGKCGLKILQYMAAGLPVVANPVGVQAEIVRHGETGFLVSTPQEWINAVARLARDPELRRRMGLAGRWVVEREFSVEVGAENWLQLLGPVPTRIAV